MVIENRMVIMKLPYTFKKHPQQVPHFFNTDNSCWHKIKGILRLLFYQEQVEVRNRQNRKQDKLWLFNLLQRVAILALDIQMMVSHVWEVISEYIIIDGTTRSLHEEGIWA